MAVNAAPVVTQNSFDRTIPAYPVDTQPSQPAVPSKPGQLALGVVSRPLLRRDNGICQGELATEMLEDLAVSDALHSGGTPTVPQRHQRSHFVYPSSREHLVNASIYAIVDLLPVQGKAEHQRHLPEGQAVHRRQPI